jgi:MoaA/NifB/PqqE/SkfB family radical SAM enzyme
MVLGAPIEAQLIVTRRCNLSCGYCFEYDNSSSPVPLSDIRSWIDSLHRLKVAHITLLGGEPLMHPEIASIVSYGRKASTVSITTNGFLLSEKTIEALNRARLSHMQISIDTSKPDPSNYIQKSLKVLRPKLSRLKRAARFDLHLAAVLCEHSKDDVLELLREAKDLGIPMSLSVVHDESGHVSITGEPYLGLYDEYGKNANHFSFSLLDYEYSRKLLEGKTPSWQCRAGARSLYVDEFGRVQYCASQRGRLNKPITEYTWNDIRTESGKRKGCEEGCAVDCVFRASQVDNDKLALVRALFKGPSMNGEGKPRVTA